MIAPTYEPLLEDLGQLDLTGIHGVFAGGESGPRARPSHPDWFRRLRDLCAAAGVAFLFKQWGEFHPADDHDPDAHKCEDTPEAIHVDGHREFRPSEAFALIAAPRKPGWVGMCKIGKKAAGRLLDGVEHNGMPGGASC